MSTCWDIYCRTCDDKLGIVDANHMADCVEKIRLNIAALAALATIAPSVCSIEVMICRRSIDIAWVGQHGGHDLVTQSEYGQLYGECNQWLPGGGICRRKPGHEGQHADEPAGV